MGERIVHDAIQLFGDLRIGHAAEVAHLHDLRERIRLDNPFLSNQARSLITQQLIASGTDPASITGATQFQLKKNLLDLGVRNEASKRNTFRIVGGLKGDLGSGWRYELSGNYGQFKESTRIEGNLNVQRFLLAMDSTRNASGQIVCRSQIDPTAGAAAEIVDDPAVLASDIASCVPLNPFGLGSISPAARNYVIQDTTSLLSTTTACTAPGMS